MGNTRGMGWKEDTGVGVLGTPAYFVFFATNGNFMYVATTDDEEGRQGPFHAPNTLDFAFPMCQGVSTRPGASNFAF